MRKITGLFSILATLVLAVIAGNTALADHTPDPSSVTIAGSLQSELGCPGDWAPDCAVTHLAYDASDDVWQNSFSVPAGSWEYKAALNDSWDENYGLNAQPGGANIPLNLDADQSVKFYYDHKSHWVTDNVNSVIATVPGSFQSELGCTGDWDPGCLRSWLQDPDGDGTYSFETSGLPAGAYEAKVAINESWDENYGAGGVPGGANFTFNVPADNTLVSFSYDPVTHLLTIRVGSGHAPDNNIEYFGLGHDSHADLYRIPFGAIQAGTELTLRFRTYHNDVTSVRVRMYDTAAAGQFFLNMTPSATDVSCYDENQPDETCDFWQVSYTPDLPTTLYYRFVIQDGTAMAYYDDDRYQNGGWGEATPDLQDDSYAVSVYEPGFEPLAWLQNGVVYQIFPDRFRNGRSNNDPTGDEPRYGYPDNPLDQILLKQWRSLPEGYCRNYVVPGVPCTEEPRGRDYFGGDLRGVYQRLNYLQRLGVTTIYFNPLFDAASNHAYDTQDYYSIDPFFGDIKEFIQLARRADDIGIHVVLDGVFNHVSSDSPYFDRYGHFDEVGACESMDSIYRSWFFFHPEAGGPCVGPDGPNTMNYDAWFGFDTLPVLDKNNPEVRDLVYAGDNSVARFWLEMGADGWRLDVMGDPSFPADFWTQFREAVKDEDPDAVIIGELWKKHEVLAFNHGDRADSVMNYRFRNAVLGFFGRVDDKGFPDDGESDQPPSLFAEKLISVREDNPDATYYNMLNLMGSHDTERILWALTPGLDNREDKEFNAENVAMGKTLLRLATVVQMTTPGAPTIYYGDEVGVTGDDDPDDRRTFPWYGDGPYGLGGDISLYEHYRSLLDLRRANPVFRSGEQIFLLADDDARTLAYLMRSPSAAALVALNRSDAAQTLTVDASGYLPAEVMLWDVYGEAGVVTAADGVLTFELPAYGAAIFLPRPSTDLVAPDAPANLMVTAEGDASVSLSWSAVPDAASYRLYRSPVNGGGYVLTDETSSTSYTDSGLVNGQWAYYVVRAVDAAGNEGAASNEAAGLPHLIIGWANLQWPPTINHTISVVNRTDNIYGQVWIDGHTNLPGQTPSLNAQVGFGPAGSDPTGPSWSWVDAVFNVDAGNNDEFMASLLPDSIGSFNYVYRYTTTGGRDWLYADLNGPVPDGAMPPNPGVLTVNASADTTPPDVPANLVVTEQSPAGISLAWDAVLGDPTLYGYEVLRSGTAGGSYELLALTTAAAYTDTNVNEGDMYYYVVRSVDLSFNRSGFSNEAVGTAELRTVTLTINVIVPDTTPPSDNVYIAGTLDLLDGGYPQWDPGATVLTQTGSYVWTISFTGRENTELQYKYTLGSWDYVEKGASCDEVANRTVLLNYGTDGTQVVNDTVLNWRNVAPCGN
ncbi:MAG: alpha-amylase family glycosyl hydrolase [Anaerolineales bacterium]